MPSPFPRFLLQAEDVIRRGHVTGVQTYALPISWRLWKNKALGNFLPFEMVRRACGFLIRERSEERRVGKECRGARHMPSSFKNLLVLELFLWVRRRKTGQSGALGNLGQWYVLLV